MEKIPKIVLYAISENGDGKVMEIGKYDSIEDIGDIVVGMFDKDTILNLEYEIEYN